MNNKQRTKKRSRRGITLTELVIGAVIGVIIILAVGIALAGNIRGWETTYGRVYSDVNRDSYAAKRAFDAVIRKSCRGKVLPTPFPTDGSPDVEVSYYYDSTITYPDRYARFFVSNGELQLEEGVKDLAGNKLGVIGTAAVCSNVQTCVFKSYGRSIQMILTLNDDRQTATVVSTAVLHNP